MNTPSHIPISTPTPAHAPTDRGQFSGIVWVLALCMPLMGGWGWGCASSSRSNSDSPYATPSAQTRDPLKAQRLTSEAAKLIDSDPDKAQSLLCEALAADIWSGSSHNDLGVVWLRKGQLFEAANEFEWARKLMPGHPDPRMNLALTLERAGRVDEALAAYDTALEVYPHHVPTMQALTRLQLRRGRTDDRTAGMLKEIALSGETPQWRTWAQQELVESSEPIR